MTNVFEAEWLPNSLAKGDRLMVPPASKSRRTLWARAQMPMWDAPQVLDFETLSAPWWLLQKGDVLTVESLSKKHNGHAWIQVALHGSDARGWILSEHAYACTRCRSKKSLSRARASQAALARPASLADLHVGAVLALQGARAHVVSWDVDQLPTPTAAARVQISQGQSRKEVWLTQLNVL